VPANVREARRTVPLSPSIGLVVPYIYGVDSTLWLVEGVCTIFLPPPHPCETGEGDLE